ncbi:AraC family transcriptional regulator [Opitutaceae bacterium TAV5]|nr:AraC family transcriptional regulator [Opitutaceae bacterium TAV5]
MATAIDSGILRLRDWSGLSCWPVYIYDRAFPVAGRSWTGIGQAHNAAWLARTGTISVTTGKHAVTAHPGEWIIPPRVSHRIQFDADADILSVRFYALWPDGRELINPPRGVVLGRESSRTLTRLAKRLERFADRNFTRADNGMEFKKADAVQYLALNSHFFAWLGELVGQLSAAGYPPTTPAHADERVLRAAHLLNTLPLSESWNLEWLARQTGLSPAQLNRLFVAAFETTPKAYHLERRKRAATHMLGEGRFSIKQVGLALGFSSTCYFTAWFRTKFGVPPGKWCREQATGR